MHSQLTLAQLKLSSAAPCGAVRCRALPCGAVLCRAALCFVSYVQYHVPCEVPVCMCVLVFFAFLIDCPLSVLFVPPPPRHLHPYCQSERDIASKHTAQHRVTSSAQVALGFIKSLVAPNHGPLISASFTFCCTLPCASVAGGVSRPRSGALV